MAKLLFDQTGEKLYEMGVTNVVLFPAVNSTTNPYPQGIAWNGITSITDSPDGAEATDLWADDIKYASMRSAETFGGSISCYTYPDEWMDCDGSATIADGVTIGQQKRTGFALAYKTTVGNDVLGEDYGYKIHIVYGATASVSEKEHATISDSPDAIEFSYDFDTTPVTVSGYKPTSKLEFDSTKCDETVMSALEDIIYGTSSTESQLPLPNDLFEELGITV